MTSRMTAVMAIFFTMVDGHRGRTVGASDAYRLLSTPPSPGEMSCHYDKGSGGIVNPIARAGASTCLSNMYGILFEGIVSKRMWSHCGHPTSYPDGRSENNGSGYCQIIRHHLPKFCQPPSPFLENAPVSNRTGWTD
jgi:hypothetical protein